MSLDGLGFLVGELTGRGGGQRHAVGRGRARHRAGDRRVGLDGGLLVQHHVQERDGAAVFGTLNVFTTDPATGDVLLYAFDSVGYPPEPAARGTWHGEELVLERTTERGSARTRFTPTPDGYRWSKEFRAPGSDVWSPVVAGELRHA